MYTSKRIFTKNENNINYQDYYKVKDGTQILKTIKAKDNLAILNQFNSYELFQKLSSAYFPFIDNNTVELSYLTNIYNDNESFMNREKLLENDTMCKNVLYPYGKIVTKKNINPQFPTNIQICKWCNQKNQKNTQYCNLDENIKPHKHKEVHKDDKDECNCKNKYNHCNLCKNARPLFI
jgi:hypothetical protein